MSFDNSLLDPVIPSEHIRHGGLTIITAAVFIAGEMAGTGLLALPQAMDKAGWSGLVSTFVLCALSGYCGMKLGDCWTILKETNSAYHEERSRSPFQVIATEGAGKVGKYVLIFVIYFQLLGAGVVFLILAAQNLKSVFDSFHAHLPVCTWLIIITAILLVPCWLGSPKDSWPMAVGAMACTGIACIIILVSILRNYHGERPPSSQVTFKSFSFSLGTMFFAWGGSAMFPTIQVDMRNPHQFHWAVIAAYIILLIFYLPVSIIGYIVYGSHVKDNILNNLNADWLRYSVEILITGHLATAFTIVLNPVFQGLEDAVRIPKHFCWQRAVLRSGVVLFLGVLALTVPHFGPILSFIGSSTVSILGFLLPVICYVNIKTRSKRLVNEGRIETIRRVIHPVEIFLLICSFLVGLFGAGASSVASFSDLVDPHTYVKPCWIDFHSADPSPPSNLTLI